MDWLRWPKAAKEHRCDWCWTAIEKGERHAYRFVTDDPGSFRMHKDCDHAMRGTIVIYSDDSFICDAQHDRGKDCDETPCGNSSNAPIEAIREKAETQRATNEDSQKDGQGHRDVSAVRTTKGD